MYSTRIIFTTLQRATLLLVLATLAACGGGSDDSLPCSRVLAVLTVGLCLFAEVTHSSTPKPPAQPAPPPTSGSGSTAPPPASPQSPPPVPSSDKLVIRRVVEFEPNSTLNNANPVAFRSATSAEHIGIDITGSVSQTDDGSDFFILTPPRTGHFLVYLCDGTCGNFLHSEQVYLMVYDQTQSTIASTPLGSDVKQQIGVDLAAGLAYYVEVNGYNTGSSPVDYKLVIIN